MQDLPAVGKIPGRAKFSDITLKRGAGSNKAVADWVKRVASGQRDLRDMKLTEIGEFSDGTTAAVRTYVFKQAWPTKWSYPTLSKWPANEYESVTLRFSSVEIS